MLQLLEALLQQSSSVAAGLAAFASVLLPLAQYQLFQPVVLQGRCQRSFERATPRLTGDRQQKMRCAVLQGQSALKKNAIGKPRSIEACENAVNSVYSVHIIMS